MLSVKGTRLLPILKLKGKQESEIFEVPRNATQPVGIERHIPVCTEDSLYSLPLK